MSRVGRKTIEIPEGVNIKIDNQNVTVSGPKGEQVFVMQNGISAKNIDGKISISRAGDDKILRSLHGTTTRVIENMVTGLSTGFTKRLDFKGVGYTIVVADGKINMRVGYSHQVIVDIPEGLEVAVVKNSINISGASKEAVGEFAAKIREIRKPEVYKGKGIKYHTEVIKKKAGKTAQSSSS